MLFRQPPPVAINYPAPSAASREKPLDLALLLRFFISSWLPIAVFAALFGAAALVYIIVTPPTFLTSAQLMLEARQVTSTDTQRTLAEQALVEGQMAIVKSNDVLLAVSRKLDLTSDLEFKSNRSVIADMLYSLLRDSSRSAKVVQNPDPSANASAQDDKENDFIPVLRRQLWVYRVGQSTVMEISAASSDPQKAAAIANAVAESYLAYNVRMKSQAAQRSSEWLAQRVSELREDVFAADRAVSQFEASGDPGGQFKLAELKSVADTYRRLYETYILSWSEAKQRISYPVSDAVFISRAAAPIAKSQPKSSLILAFALVLGASFGMTSAIIRRVVNRTITSAEHIGSEVGAPCIGVVALAGRIKSEQKELPTVDGQRDTTKTRARSFDCDLKDLRATLAGLRRSRRMSLIGIMGAETGVGATTIAYNLALLASRSGSKTLLIDAAAGNPTLSRAFAEKATPGLMEIIDDPDAYAEVMSAAAGTALTVLPIGSCGNVTPGERISSEHIAFSFTDLKERFDFVLIDLPSPSGSADAKAIAPQLDGSIVVVRHGETSLDTLNDAVGSLHGVGSEVVGIVLNAAPARRR